MNDAIVEKILEEREQKDVFAKIKGFENNAEMMTMQWEFHTKVGRSLFLEWQADNGTKEGMIELVQLQQADKALGLTDGS